MRLCTSCACHPRIGGQHLSGGEGNHRLTATAVFSSATSILDGGAADNVLFAADATEFGDGGRHELFGDEGDDELTAVAGGHSFGTPNLLDGSAGSDVLRGGSGRDTLIIDAEDLIGAGASVSGGPGAFDRPDPFGDRLVVDLTLISLPSAIRRSPILKVWT